MIKTIATVILLIAVSALLVVGWNYADEILQSEPEKPEAVYTETVVAPVRNSNLEFISDKNFYNSDVTIEVKDKLGDREI